MGDAQRFATSGTAGSEAATPEWVNRRYSKSVEAIQK